MLKSEVTPYWNLSVTVLRAKNTYSHDMFSQSDLFVTLHLPTASARTHRTKTVNENLNPEWNETFHFRIQKNVKNVLEISMYDEDLLSNELCYTVLFDIQKLSPGKETKCFTQKDSELWVEFELTKSKDPPVEYFSNGVLVASPLSYLEVNVKKFRHATENLILKLIGAYQEEKLVMGTELASKNAQPLGFYINRNLETELKVHLSNNTNSAGADQTDGRNVQAQDASLLSALPLKLQAARQEVKLSVPVGQEVLDLQLKSKDSQDKGLEVRLGFDIPEAEKNFLEKRKLLAGKAIKKALKLTYSPEQSKVPVLAIAGSGGGTRAMTALYGSLKGLQTLGLLDAVSYISGVSGSTWTISKLYGDPDWSQRDMQQHVSAMEAAMSRSFYWAFSSSQRQYYAEELKKRQEEGHVITFIDVWGLALEYLLYGEKREGTLSEQQRAVQEGQNPYPIYNAVNMKDGTTTEAEWCEFSPYEVSLPKYGASVPTEAFGSEFYLGRLIKKLPESRLSFLLGLWSSIFSCNLAQLWGLITGSEQASDQQKEQGRSGILDSPEPSILDTYFFTPLSSITNMLTSLLNGRPIINQTYNFLRGFNMHSDYSENKAFKAWEGTHPDAFPNKMTPNDSKLRLVDCGFVNNIGLAPLLRPQRGANVIFSFNYSWDVDQLRVLKITQEYCTERGLPFPSIDFSKIDGQTPKEIYVFEDEKNPQAPIVLHFPLVNVTFKEFRVPGIKRKGAEELKAGDVDVSSSNSPYTTTTMTYSAEDFRRLVELTSYNVVNNKEVIYQALQRAIDRRRLGRNPVRS
ncbi:cytosolic phospholipase A2 zeta isoform X2 [Scleropages formosus]|uniref:cytosolic phospholipase A2 zeta isoform X2 n=1 Tax=Scleropages formosus TaxID=113540 RepID=UPI00087805DF|nr:cytosolic phospholipase A2 zeta-like isoform X2 [Scleropages formosus]